MNKRDVWIAADCIVSPLGLTTNENYENVKAGKTGISLLKNSPFSTEPVYAGLIEKDISFAGSDQLTRFETICILSIKQALQQTQLDVKSDKVIFILSTTKGNIELLTHEGYDADKINLSDAANTITKHFKNKQQPIVVSNACVSGVMAILVAKRIIQSGQYDHAVVIGADVISKFVLSGFLSLNAVSMEACKPFDSKRKGVTLGEAAATIILTANPASIKVSPKVKVMGGGLSNDANHISGPSRTGEELAMAVTTALSDAEVNKEAIDFISAHGTATLYNDEMESKAFNIAGMATVPLNSLKGYFGHTLGAAGVVETILSVHALLNNELIPTLGFKTIGVSQPMNVIDKLVSKEINICLKTASGFGGCNAAIVLNKVV